jgi:hypothetical protein
VQRHKRSQDWWSSGSLCHYKTDSFSPDGLKGLFRHRVVSECWISEVHLARSIEPPHDDKVRITMSAVKNV